MVSGLVTSPEDQSWICLVEARPILIASKSLMSITGTSHPSEASSCANAPHCGATRRPDPRGARPCRSVGVVRCPAGRGACSGSAGRGRWPHASSLLDLELFEVRREVEVLDVRRLALLLVLLQVPGALVVGQPGGVVLVG